MDAQHSSAGAAHANGFSILQQAGENGLASSSEPSNAQTSTAEHSTSSSGGVVTMQAAHAPSVRASDQAMRQACFNEELAGIRVCFQLVDLGRQVYLWAGLESGAMGCMCLASSPPSAGIRALPPVATLVRGSGDSVGASVAQRLAAKTGRSVAVAWALPDEPPMLSVLAERRTVQGLQEMGLVQLDGQ